MFSTFFKINKILFSQKVNMWIYGISKIPVIGKSLSLERFYAQSEAKNIASNIIKVLSIILSLIGKFMYIFLAIILPSIFIAKKVGIDNLEIKFHILFFLSFVAGPFFQNKFTTNISRDFYMINLMRFNPKKYYLSGILLEYIKDFIFLIIPMKLLGISFLQSLIIMLEFVAVRAIMQCFFIFASGIKGQQLSSKVSFLATAGLVPFTLAYAGPFLKIKFDSRVLLFNKTFIILILALGMISLIYIIKYDGYTKIAKKIIAKDDIDKVTIAQKDAMFADVKINELKIEAKDLNNDKYDHKKGIDYLNAKFVERHKKIVINPIKIRVIGIGVVFLVAVVIIFTMPELKPFISDRIIKSSGMLVFVLYLISIGEKITKAFFFNCDNSLLRHKFYKEPEILLDNFKSRLKIISLLNLIPAMCIAVSMLLINILSGGNTTKLIPIFVSIITLSCFFSVHYLFLYYVTQPYTSQLTIKSPIYHGVSMAVWIVSYACLQVETASSIFTFAIIISTLTYVLIALRLVYKYAPRNFRLK